MGKGGVPGGLWYMSFLLGVGRVLQSGPRTGIPPTPRKQDQDRGTSLSPDGYALDRIQRLRYASCGQEFYKFTR